MKYEEKKMNLFDVAEEYYLAHCISSDFGMGAGIAVQFNERFNMKNRLLKKYNGQLVEYPKVILVDRVFNLVTKDKCYEKPTYESIEKAIGIMSNICKQDNIKYLAMPKIGCGIDGLSWDRVSEIIKDKFADLEINILVCVL